jgi:L-seryl-tRNA(Ser) seleniumtransferase
MSLRSKTTVRQIPAVEKVLQALGPVLPRPALLAIVRGELAALRKEKEVPGFDAILQRIRSAITVFRASRIQPVINATGILIHTNLGRAPLAIDGASFAGICWNYCNLEYDLATGQRGGRAEYLDKNLALLCGAEAATVVNNCAAALVLILRHFAAVPQREVIISRGELIQIGGGFRIPEILEASGARLLEVGTTNKTSLADYARAIGRESALILKVHRSNFFMRGFVESVPTEELAALAKSKRLPLVEDLGSGAMTPTEQISGVEHEPTPSEVLKHGVDLVCFSGDKLLGGPQAGIIAGKAKLVQALKREPFFRALRCDKLVLSVLQTTVEHYLDGSFASSIPILKLLSVPNEALRGRAEKIITALKGLPLKATVGEGKAQLGGGTLPQTVLASVTVDLLPSGISLEEFAARLRTNTPPVIGYVSKGRFKLDLRTVFPAEDELIVQAIHAGCVGASGG